MLRTKTQLPWKWQLMLDKQDCHNGKCAGLLSRIDAGAFQKNYTGCKPTD